MSNRLELELDEVYKDVSTRLAALDTLKAAFQAFPDLQSNTDRWGTVRYCSVTVNIAVTDVEISFSCGCCEDAGLVCRPYILMHGMKIFSSPVEFLVGEKSLESGVIEYEGWREKLKLANINAVVVNKIIKYFMENPSVEGVQPCPLLDCDSDLGHTR